MCKMFTLNNGNGFSVNIYILPILLLIKLKQPGQLPFCVSH